MRRHIPRSIIAKLQPRLAPKPVAFTRSFAFSSRRNEVAESSIPSSPGPSTLPVSQTSEEKAYYVTTPIFYVNASPHIGHLHSLVLADVFARYQQLRNPSRKVIFSTGTDEHGMKIQQAAKKAGVDEKRFCDVVSKRFENLAKISQISHTDFIRTSEERHHRSVHAFWQRLMDSGSVYKGSHAGWYSVSDECFYQEKQVKEVDGKMIAIETSSEVTWEEEENYKFRLSDYKDRLLEWARKPESIHPPFMRDYVISQIEQMGDLAISRPASRVQWGVSVPNDPEHTVYVWVDALVNYLTVVPDGGWPADMHVVGKDIIKFHAVHWPALLMAAGIEPPKTVLSHAHWTMGRRKMSKSTGNVVDPVKAIQTFGSDGVRFFLMKQGGSLPQDSDYSDLTLNAEYQLLSNQIGNLAARIGVPRMFQKIKPLPLRFSEPVLDDMLFKLPQKYIALMDRYEISKACEAILEVVAEANRVFTAHAPWKGDNPSIPLMYAFQALKMAGVLLKPIMPAKADLIIDRIGLSPYNVSLETLSWIGPDKFGLEDKFDVYALAQGLKEAHKRWGNKKLFPPVKLAIPEYVDPSGQVKKFENKIPEAQPVSTRPW